jgi:hypothetical protein
MADLLDDVVEEGGGEDERDAGDKHAEPARGEE